PVTARRALARCPARQPRTGTDMTSKRDDHVVLREPRKTPARSRPQAALGGDVGAAEGGSGVVEAGECLPVGRDQAGLEVGDTEFGAMGPYDGLRLAQ